MKKREKRKQRRTGRKYAERKEEGKRKGIITCDSGRKIGHVEMIGIGTQGRVVGVLHGETEHDVTDNSRVSGTPWFLVLRLLLSDALVNVHSVMSICCHIDNGIPSWNT